MKRLSRDYSWPILFILPLSAVLLRLFIFAYVDPKPLKFYTPDSYGYDQLAVNLMGSHVFSANPQAPFSPELQRTPGYPALMAGVYSVVGHLPGAVILLQGLLGGLLTLLVLVLCSEMRLSRRVGVIAAVIVAVEPVSIMTSTFLLTETVFTVLLLAGIVLLWHYWHSGRLWPSLASAVVLSLSSLVRPIAQFLPLVLLPLFFLANKQPGRRAIMGGLLFVIVCGMITGSWFYRNYQESGLWTLSTIDGVNLIDYRARAVLAEVEGISQEDALLKIEEQVGTVASQQRLSPAETDALRKTVSLRLFREHPTATVSVFVKGAARMLIDPGFSNACTLLDLGGTEVECFSGYASMNDSGVAGKIYSKFIQMSPLQQFVLLWSMFLWTFIYLGSLVGMVWLARSRRWLPLGLLAGLVFYFVALSAGPEAYSRFRVPLVPFVAVLTAIGCEALWGFFRTRGSHAGVVPSPKYP